MNLLFAINQKFTDLLCNCIHSIIKNGASEHYDVFILHSDLCEQDKNKISQVGTEQMSCHYIPVDEDIFEGFPVSNRYPLQIYYRLVAPLLLPKEMERILYLDVDLVVINPLDELYNTDFEGNYYVACTHVKECLTKINQVRLGVENAPYINTGVMLMNLSALRENLTIQQIRETAQKKMFTFLLPDQDLLTVIYGERIKLVDTMRFNLSDRILSFYNSNPKNNKCDLYWIRKNTVIIHYCGKNKPWEGSYNGILDIFYYELLWTK